MDYISMLDLIDQNKRDKGLEKVIEHNLSREFETVELYPVSDLHIGDPNTDIPMFQKFIKLIQEKPNRFILCNGDLMNNAIKSSVSNIYEESIKPSDQKKILVKLLEPIKDRILVITSGNHEDRTRKDADQDITEDVATLLNKLSVYKPDDAIVKITFGTKAKNLKRQCYSIYLTHGNGGGKRPGSSLNNIELLGLSIDADIYIIGHTHKRMAYKSTFRKPDLKNNVIRETERLFVVSSHWQDFVGGYAVRKMLNPSAKGSVPIILHAKEKGFDAIV